MNPKFKIGDTVKIDNDVTDTLISKVIEVKLSSNNKFMYRLESRPFVFFYEEILEPNENV